jgi:hypothetical protein
MFRNESDNVARRAEQRYIHLAKMRDTKDLSSLNTSSLASNDTASVDLYSLNTWDHFQLAIPPNTQPLLSTLVPSIEDQAIGFFFTKYVMPPKLVPRGELDFLPELIGKPSTEKILQASVTATGLACLGMSTQSPKILAEARQSYVYALRITNEAIRHPELVKRDSTLLSVILLGMYENSMSGDVYLWRKHVEGACAIITLRGEQGLRHSIGLRLFQQFYNTILLSAFETRMGIPPGMNELYAAGSRIYNYNVHGRVWTTRIVSCA